MLCVWKAAFLKSSHTYIYRFSIMVAFEGDAIHALNNYVVNCTQTDFAQNQF